jgi:hypothetical protein
VVTAVNPRPAGIWDDGERSGDAADYGVDTAGAEERVVPALVQHDEPLDERESQHELSGRPGEDVRLHGQNDAEPSRQRDGRDRESARGIRRAQVLELRRAWSGLVHVSSFCHAA